MGQDDLENKAVAPKGNVKPVRKYPNNGLKEPVRSFESTFSAVTVLKQMFHAAQ